MKFPDYVPPAVQEYIAILLEGQHGNPGWLAVKDKPGHEYIAEIVAFLQRFEKPDEVIQEMFHHLEDAKLSEADLKQFMNAAWVANPDHKKYRDAIRKADKLRLDIAKSAEALSRQLNEILRLPLTDTPMTFYSLPALLRSTDNRDDPAMWPLMRPYVLGEPIEQSGEATAPAVADEVTVTVDRSVKVTICEANPDPAHNVWPDLRYAWGIAPDLPQLLETVAKAARDYEPRFYGRIGDAIAKQKPSPKTEYIRALRSMLKDARIDETPAVRNAIACVTTVALNDPDMVASYDDVRQALGLKQKSAG